MVKDQAVIDHVYLRCAIPALYMQTHFSASQMESKLHCSVNIITEEPNLNNLWLNPKTLLWSWLLYLLIYTTLD